LCVDSTQIDKTLMTSWSPKFDFSFCGSYDLLVIATTVPFSSMAVALWTKFSLSGNFRRILGVCTRRLHMFCRLRASRQPGSSWKALVSREDGVNGCLSPTITLLSSRSNCSPRVLDSDEGVCRYNSSSVYKLYDIDRQSQPNQQRCWCWNCRIKHLLFADNLVLLASSQQGDRFFATKLHLKQ